MFTFFDLVSSHKMELTIKIRADIPEQTHGTHVFVLVPLPRTATSVVTELGDGNEDAAALAKEQNIEFDEKTKTVRWYAKKFEGQTEHVIRIRVSLSEAADASIRKSVGPIAMHFEVPMFLSSGVQVKYLRTATQQPYEMERWIRYVSRAGSYICRM